MAQYPSSSSPTSYISLKNDLRIPDDATITGVGSPNFNDAGYGTLTLTSGPYAGQTVTQAIQATLDTAATAPLGIIWDVRCSVGVNQVPGLGGDEMLSALYLRRPGNLHIVAVPGCGAILRAQSNAAVMSIEPYTGRFGVPSANIGTDQQINTIGNIQFSNLLIEGLYLNANSGVISSYTAAPNQLHPTFSETFYLNVMRLHGVQDATFRDCSFVGGAGFHLYFGNWRRILFDNCTVDDLGGNATLGGNDSFHLNGPGDDFQAINCHLASSDDIFGLNTADGSNASGRNHGPSVPAWGSVTRVRAYNSKLLRAGHGNFVRVMAAAGCANGGHEFDGVYGQVFGLGLVLQSESSGSGSGTIGSVRLANLDVDFTRSLMAGVGTGTLSAAGAQHLEFDGVRRSGSNLAVPLITNQGPIQRLVVNDVYVVDDGTSATNKPQIQIAGGGTVSAFSAIGVGLVGNSAGQNMPLLQIDSGATVSKALIAGAESTNVAAFVKNNGTLSNLVVSGSDATTSVSGTAAAAHSGDSFH